MGFCVVLGLCTDRLKERVHSVAQDKACYEATDKTAKVSLPGYIGEKGYYETASDYCYPEREGGWYGKHKDW